MNWVDLVIIAVFGFYLFEGIRRGFIEQLLELIGFFATIFLALWVYKPVANWIVANIGIDANKADPVGFFVAWLALQAIYSLILHFAYPYIPAKIRNATFNRLAGLFPSFAKAFILIAVIITVAVLMPIPATLRTQIEEASVGKNFVEVSGKVELAFNKLFGRDLKESLTILTVPPVNEKIINPDVREELGFTYDNGKVDNQSEQKMLTLINSERIKEGLKPLVWDESLAQAARNHSQDMLKKGYFGHINLEGQDPFARMKAAGIDYQAAGENLAFAMTVDLAHNGLMRSPGHRKNILEKDFRKVGIGVIEAGKNGRMFTQLFTN